MTSSWPAPPQQHPHEAKEWVCTRIPLFCILWIITTYIGWPLGARVSHTSWSIWDSTIVKFSPYQSFQMGDYIFVDACVCKVVWLIQLEDPFLLLAVWQWKFCGTITAPKTKKKNKNLYGWSIFDGIILSFFLSLCILLLLMPSFSLFKLTILPLDLQICKINVSTWHTLYYYYDEEVYTLGIAMRCWSNFLFK